MENKLPKNWVETDLEHLFNLVYGKGLSVSELLDEGFDVYGANGIIGKYDKFTYEKSKIVISCRGAASGVIHKTNPKSFITSNSIVLDEISDTLLNLDFVKYAMTIADKSDVITGTAQPQITIQLLKYLSFPLPPLAEQNRIVAKLDALFVQLETIKASMAKVPLLLKDFRQQVLTQAVTGKLTEEWRKGKELEEWRKVELGKICSLKAGKFVSASEISNEILDGYFPCYGGNGLRGYVKSFTHIGRYSLIGRQGALCGNVHLIDGQFHATEHALVVTPLENIDEIWLFFKLTSLELINYSKGVAQPGLSVMNLNPIPLNIPPMEEQQEIVSRVDSLFAKADALEKQYETLKAKIESLPQALLHKAFKGELTEQLDSDGDARELLREIEMLKQVQQDKSKKGKSKTNTSVTQKV
jgi:type I restriction enzyme S subunit